MKRTSLQTTVSADTKKGLEAVAKREGLTDHGQLSKGRAIDFLWNFYYELKINR